MLKYGQLGNLFIIDDDHNSLLTSKNHMQALRRIFAMCSALVNRKLLERSLIENYIVVRLNSDASLIIYANIEFQHNPMFYAYNNHTGAITNRIHIKDLEQLFDQGNFDYFKRRIGQMEKIDMSRFISQDTVKAVRKDAENYSETYIPVELEEE